MAHMISNTDKVYPCTQCGSTSSNIVRESPDPRLKCNACNFTYNGSDSLAAAEAGAIPDGPPAPPPPTQTVERPSQSAVREAAEKVAPPKAVPRTPAYVFLSKDRKEIEFCNTRDLKKTTLKWEQTGKYDVYQLTPKKIEAKVTIE